MYLTQHNAGNEGGTLQNTSSRAGPRKLNPILTFMVVDNSDYSYDPRDDGRVQGRDYYVDFHTILIP